MRNLSLAALALIPVLMSCSAIGGEKAPEGMNDLCVATVANGGGNTVVDLTLAEFLRALSAKGFVASWSGSDDAPVLTVRNEDTFSGKTNEVAFEMRKAPYSGSVGQCVGALAVLARARVNGEVLDAYSSEDLVLGLAQKIRDARPSPVRDQPKADDELPMNAPSEMSQNSAPDAIAAERQRAIARADDFANRLDAAGRDAVASENAKEKAAAEDLARRDAQSFELRQQRQVQHDKCAKVRSDAQAAATLENQSSVYQSFHCD